MNTPVKKYRKRLKGIIVSDKMEKTIVVKVSSFAKHPKYKKYIQRNKKYKVHDPLKKHAVGDTVFIEECRPISKDKKFRIVEVSV